MGFFSWLGFGKPRDAPDGAKTERPGLPEITDNVRDSGQTFFFGTASSGERVDEKSAMQISTVYACVRLLAETVAGLPLHLYRYTGNGDAKEKALDHPLYKILYRKPNPEMTSFTFRETMMTHLLLWGNAYAQIIRDGKNTVLGLYPLLPENVEVDRDEAIIFITPTPMKCRGKTGRISTSAPMRSSTSPALVLTGWSASLPLP